MDNVVQNIKLEDIIPRDSQNEEPQKIEELVSSIQKFGVVEPILVRPKNGKYELILGDKRYKASRKLGLETIPALVKNVDDEIVQQYLMINKKQNATTSSNKFITPNLTVKKEDFTTPKQNSISPPSQKQRKKIPPSSGIQENEQFKINYNQKQTTDIINLSELSKEEYERDDFNMNNEQMNTNVMNNLGTTPMRNTSQEPTFGGRFFPSLEDEPTNMNMGGLNTGPMTSPAAQSTNNLIDLTDLGIEKDFSVPTPTPAMAAPTSELNSVSNNFSQNMPEINAQPLPNTQENIVSTRDFTTPDLNSNIINIGNLQSNNPPIEPTIGINNQFGGSIPNTIPNMEQPQNIPQFDMSQNIAPTEFIQQQEMNAMPSMNIPQNDFTGISNNSMNFNQPNEFIMNQPGIPSMMDPGMNSPMSEPNIPTYNQNVEPQIAAMSMNNMMPSHGKDVTPIVNTLKSLATSLEAFGYQINISEEELPTSVKITMEVEK